MTQIAQASFDSPGDVAAEITALRVENGGLIRTAGWPERASQAKQEPRILSSYTISEERLIDKAIAERTAAIKDEIKLDYERYAEILSDVMASYIAQPEHVSRLNSLAAGEILGHVWDAKSKLRAHNLAKGILSALIDGDAIEFERLFDRQLSYEADTQANQEFEQGKLNVEGI